jgi:hypothetical protein
MQVATATEPSFTKRLCAAYDFNRGSPPADGAERATREDIIEYIDAHKSPGHPTTAIAWDLQRTLGEADGQRLLQYASLRWDAEPLTASEIVRMGWEDDYEPRAWVDEYLVDLIRDWRWQRGRLQLCADAEKEWLAFKGFATLDQFEAWYDKYGAWYLSPDKKLGPVKVVSSKNMRRIERIKERTAVLLRAYENGWPKYEKFTPKESWVWDGIMFGGLRFCLLDDTENNVAYFEWKLYRLYQQYVVARNDVFGLNQKPKMQLGLKLLGKKGRRN